MARIFVTGSSDGLGSLAAQALVKNGHKVVLHGRNAQRAADAQKACPGAESVLVGDLSSLSETKKLAKDANESGPFDCVIHNAGLYRGGYMKQADRLPSMTTVNTVAPYMLTCLLTPRPKRFIFLSSGLHNGGDASLNDWLWQKRGEKGWTDMQAYSDTKLHNVMLAKAFARKWGDAVTTSSLDPGWMPTKMGGSSATGELKTSIATYVKLAEGREERTGNGSYFHYSDARERAPKKGAETESLQNKLMEDLAEITNVKVPA